jgi:hypothetical protein
MAWQILKTHRIATGPIEASILTYIPIEEEKALEHFFQAIIPEAHVKTPFGSLSLQCHFKEKKLMQAHFRIDDTECDFTVSPHILQVSGKFQEKHLSRSLIKLALVSLSLAKEITCAAHQGSQLLRLFGRPNFPSTIVIHNSLRGSEELWQSQFTNIHRNFYAFPEVKDKEDYSISERLILNDKIAVCQFPPELLHNHLAKFRVAFLREVITALEREEVYIPPSLLKAYAPKGEECQELVKELTAVYEEKLKKGQLEREQRERDTKLFINRSNLWLSLIVLLFSLANIAQNQWINFGVMGIAVVFVIFLVLKNWKMRGGQEEEE